jgi:hypothetical protein
MHLRSKAADAAFAAVRRDKAASAQRYRMALQLYNTTQLP